jgi:1-deoxy-D-xylulose-5-phosphate reductoisomerase
MRRKIAILGSTGSIGKSLLEIIHKDKKNFEIKLLTAKKNYKVLFKQAKYFNVRNIIITDKKYYNIAKLKNDKNIKIYNNFNDLNKIFKKKIDYTMSSIIGLDGLVPTIEMIKFTKKIAIANKESIICAWNLIKKELIKNNTQFIPVDSEHFSIWYALKNNLIKNIKRINLTASGGPLLNYPLKKFDKLKISEVLKHPNWKMGKKITIDSSTMMNKVFEIIEAKKIFDVPYSKLSILIHPNSYVHALLEFNNGLVKVIIHDTTMKIPIFNTLYDDGDKIIKSQKLNIKKLNNLNLSTVDQQKFPLIKTLKILPKNDSLFETLLVSANDELVNLFLQKKIRYIDISKKLLKFIQKKEFKKLKFRSPQYISEIINLNKYVRFKIKTKGI